MVSGDWMTGYIDIINQHGPFVLTYGNNRQMFVRIWGYVRMLYDLSNLQVTWKVSLNISHLSS